MLFYQQAGAKLGLDKYSIINVQYDNQVVATRKGTTGKIDSLQALKNIQKMIESSKQMSADTLSTTVDNNIASNDAAMPTLTILKDKQGNATVKDSFNNVPPSAPVRTGRHPTPLKNRALRPAKKAKQPPKPTRQPKAVMRSVSG